MRALCCALLGRGDICERLMHTGVLQAARIQGLEGEVHLQSIKNGTTLLHREIFKARTLARRLIYTRTTTYCPFISEAIIAVKLSYGKQSQFYRATLLISSNSSSALALPPSSLAAQTLQFPVTQPPRQRTVPWQTRKPQAQLMKKNMCTKSMSRLHRISRPPATRCASPLLLSLQIRLTTSSHGR